MALTRTPIRPPEAVTAAYLGATVLMILAAPTPLGEWWPVLVMQLALLAAVLVGLPMLPARGWPDALRDLIIMPAIFALYFQVGLLNDLFTSGFYDEPVIALERAIFGGDPSRSLRQALPWWPVAEYLHFGYFGYYTLFVLPIVLYRDRRLAEYRYVITVALTALFICYLIFIVYPVAGPWFVGPRPDPIALGYVFPRVVHEVLGTGGVPGLTFPSSHVAVAFAIWLLSWRFLRRLFWILTAIVPALTIATFYGGFHYAVDALAGALLGAVVVLLGPWIWRAAGGRPLEAARAGASDPAEGSVTAPAHVGLDRQARESIRSR